MPVLIEEARGRTGNPWGVSFMTMFHMSNDSGLFRTAAQLREVGFVRDGADWAAPEGIRPGQGALDIAGTDRRGLPLAGGIGRRNPERFVPLYEAKMIHQFDHRWATFDGMDSRDLTPAEKADPGFEPTPRYWVPEAEAPDRLRARNWSRDWLIGLCGITNATNERTIISCVWPYSGVGNSCLFG